MFRRRLLVALVAGVVLVAAGCTKAQVHVDILASDALGGRQNATADSVAAQDYIISQLREYGAAGLDGTQAGDEAYRQHFTDGTNILGVLRGTDLPDEYVMVAGHYDHLGHSCRNVSATDDVCNGATDNAAGTAAALDVGRRLAETPGGLHRSVIIALWDREEDGLLGSAYYTQHPLVPNASIAAYVNFDIQGANLLPSLRSTTFAVGAETGGARLTDAVAAAANGRLDERVVSSIFGQGRSDYVNFTAVGVPNVFFSDSTGPCYHTVDDEPAIVDWGKLGKQIDIATDLTRDLVAGTRPTFVPNTPLATYADAVELQAVVDGATGDLGRFTPAQQTQLLQFQTLLHTVVADGPDQFDGNDIGPLLSGAVNAVSTLTAGGCDGFLAP